LRQKFLDFMDDDFNTGGAIGVLFDILRLSNKLCDEVESGNQDSFWDIAFGAMVLRELTLTLGLFREPPTVSAQNENSELVGKLMTLLIELRASARQNKDFATADKIRKDLTEFGITWSRQIPATAKWLAN